MGTLTFPYTLQAGTPENVNHLNSNLTAIANVLNGNVDSANITDGTITATDLIAAVQAAAGLNGASTRRGKTIIATEESTTSATYTTLTTPDRVSNIVMPTDGLIYVAYRAMWKESVAGASRAAIFVGANQLRYGSALSAAPVVQEVAVDGTGGVYKPLSSSSQGLHYTAGGDGTAYTGDVTTGQTVAAEGTGTDAAGGACLIFAAAGTYDVSVQFKASSGSVTAKNRKLWAWSMGYD